MDIILDVLIIDLKLIDSHKNFCMYLSKLNLINLINFAYNLKLSNDNKCGIKLIDKNYNDLLLVYNCEKLIIIDQLNRSQDIKLYSYVFLNTFILLKYKLKSLLDSYDLLYLFGYKLDMIDPSSDLSDPILDTFKEYNF